MYLCCPMKLIGKMLPQEWTFAHIIDLLVVFTEIVLEVASNQRGESKELFSHKLAANTSPKISLL